MRLLEQERVELPDGCHVTYELEAIDIIKFFLCTRTADDAILAFYDDFRQRDGTRPTAVELYDSATILAVVKNARFSECMSCVVRTSSLRRWS